MKLSEVIIEFAKQIEKDGDEEVVTEKGKSVNTVHFQSVKAVDTNYRDFPAVVIRLRRMT